MIVLGFILCVIYIPGTLGVSISPAWSLLSFALPIATWRRVPWTPSHWLMLGFLAYATASLAWAPNWYYGVYQLWMTYVVAFSWLLGSQLQDPKPLLRGIALGLSISSLLCIAQAMGHHPVLEYSWTRPAGLFFNPIVLSESIALVLVWLTIERMWWYIPLLLPGFVLPLGRGAWVATALALSAFAFRGRPKLLLALPVLALASLPLVLWLSTTGALTADTIRWQLWQATAEHLTARGSGAGAMYSVYLDWGAGLVSPEFAHNEPLDLLYQYGLGALPLFAVGALALTAERAAAWYVFLAFLIMASFSFPLHVLPTAFIGAFCLGRLCRGWHLHGYHLLRWRHGLLRWLGWSQALAYSRSSRYLPVLTNHST